MYVPSGNKKAVPCKLFAKLVVIPIVSNKKGISNVYCIA